MFSPDFLEILHFDRDLAVVIKPVGISSEGEEGMPGLVKTALAHKGVSCTVYPLHRLDTAVSGVMIFALNKTAAAKCQRKLQKTS